MSDEFRARLRDDFNTILFDAGVKMPDPTDPDLWPEMVEELLDATTNRIRRDIYELRRTL